MPKTCKVRNKQATGFSLIELLVVLLILGVVTGAIYAQITAVQQRGRTEQVKLDYMQESRDFVDQFFRDINQIGYPNSRMVDTTSVLWVPALSSPLANDSRLAVGLVKADAQEIRFEGDIAGTGKVQSVVYKLNGSGTCALCFQRSQTDKASGDPLTGQTQNWGTEVNDLANATIFTYFKADGTQVTGVPVDMSTAAGAQTLASIKSIQISVRVLNAGIIDPKTRQPIEMTFEGEVSVNNCSMVANGQPMSCK
ncbi:MAG TPA: prepilin-type N-terminal cleavage/methylation domain-containing protein [Candidatus Elarobacter sp.]|nr:prepilin-type N-terminal cleavage/methylation domain-containing protein [Candidatus Elarobacter sp.]